MKHSRSGTFYETWEEAHAHLIKSAESKIEYQQRELLHFEEDLVRIRGMKNPDLSQIERGG